MTYVRSVQDIANAAIDGAVEDAAVDAMVAETALRLDVDPDALAADVEERLAEMRALRDEERRHLEA